MKYFRLMSAGVSVRLGHANLITLRLHAQVEAGGQQTCEGIHTCGIETAAHTHVGRFRIHQYQLLIVVAIELGRHIRQRGLIELQGAMAPAQDRRTLS